MSFPSSLHPSLTGASLPRHLHDTREGENEADSERLPIARTFSAGVYCTHVDASANAAGHHPATITTLVCQCNTVQELLTVLEDRVHPHVHPAAAAAGATGESTAFWDKQGSSFFLWVDMHGVPTPHKDGTDNDSRDGKDLTALWRMLGLNEAKTAAMGAVADSFRATETAPPANEPYADRREQRATTLGDMYYEDPRIQDADSVSVQSITPTSSTAAPPGPTTVGCAVVSEVAVMLETPPHTEGSRWCDAPCGKKARCASSGGADPIACDNEADENEVTVLGGLAMPTREEIMEELRCPHADRCDCLTSDAVAGMEMDLFSPLDGRCLCSYDDHELRGEDGVGGKQRLPLISSLYLIALPNVCVTWCPASSFGRAAAAIASTGPPSEEPVLTRSVKDWHRLQEAVVARMRGGAGNTAAGPAPTTAQFASLLLATVCYAYLPDTTAVLNEVDSIDAMLPLIVPDRESDQADALRRVLVLRRRLAVHRRLLYQKMRLLEELQRPAMRTLAAFMNEGIGTETYQSIQGSIQQVLRTLEGARTTLGNSTLVYTSAVTFRSCQTSTRTDYFQLSIVYMLMVLLPLSAVASHWGLNCFVPWSDQKDTLVPFWGIVGVIGFLAIVGLPLPIYAYRSGKMDLIM